jgi:hypothetical protein
VEFLLLSICVVRHGDCDYRVCDNKRVEDEFSYFQGGFQNQADLEGLPRPSELYTLWGATIRLKNPLFN